MSLDLGIWDIKEMKSFPIISSPGGAGGEDKHWLWCGRCFIIFVSPKMPSSHFLNLMFWSPCPLTFSPPLCILRSPCPCVSPAVGSVSGHTSELPIQHLYLSYYRNLIHYVHIKTCQSLYKPKTCQDQLLCLQSLKSLII